MESYQGPVRLSGGGVDVEFAATIDDLDNDNWGGRGSITPDTRFIPGNVTVTLAEGSRAHQTASAAVDSDGPDAVRLRGLSAFS